MYSIFGDYNYNIENFATISNTAVNTNTQIKSPINYNNVDAQGIAINKIQENSITYVNGELSDNEFTKISLFPVYYENSQTQINNINNINIIKTTYVNSYTPANTKSLKDIFINKNENFIYINEMNNLPINSKVLFVAEVVDSFSGISKNEKKTRFLRLKTTDETGSINVLLFNDKIDLNKNLNNNKNYEATNIIIVKGIKKEDAVFADIVAIQDHKIYMKLSELKN